MRPFETNPAELDRSPNTKKQLQEFHAVLKRIKDEMTPLMSRRLGRRILSYDNDALELATMKQSVGDAINQLQLETVIAVGHDIDIIRQDQSRIFEDLHQMNQDQRIAIRKQDEYNRMAAQQQTQQHLFTIREQDMSRQERLPQLKIKSLLVSNVETLLTLASHLKWILGSDNSLCTLVYELSEQLDTLGQEVNSQLDNITTTPLTTNPGPLPLTNTYTDAALRGTHHHSINQNTHPDCTHPFITTTPAPTSTPPSDTQLLLVQSNPKKPVLSTCDPKLIIDKLQKAIRTAAITNNGKAIRIHTIRILASKDISITTHTKDDANLLCKNDTWVMAVSSDLCIHHEVYPIIIHYVPASFDPTNQADADKLIDDNANVLGSFKHMCWANAKKAQAEDPKDANLTIDSCISIDGTL
ncbi:hypothetical protein FRB95_001389 [Tulasnella sp. JGI-2019a]|nr:hypothetical protein FRB95_001389 [Tulasnella sp. JGI-2019a]